MLNIGSVGFENVACIFDESRLQRKCSIVTDLDVVVEGAKKSNQTAMDRGASRRKKLSQLFGENPYVIKRLSAPLGLYYESNKKIM